MEYSCTTMNSEGGMATLRTGGGPSSSVCEKDISMPDVNIPPVVLGDGFKMEGFELNADMMMKGGNEGEQAEGDDDCPESPMVNLIKKQRDTTTAWNEQRPRKPNNKPAIRRAISASHSSRKLMREMSGLGMVDPVFGDTEEEAEVNHPSQIFSDMCFADIPEDMRDVVSVASDNTATKDDGLDVEMFQNCLGVDNLHNSISNFSASEISRGGKPSASKKKDKDVDRLYYSFSHLEFEPDGAAGSNSVATEQKQNHVVRRSSGSRKKVPNSSAAAAAGQHHHPPQKVSMKHRAKKQQQHPHAHDDWHASVTTLESFVSDPAGADETPVMLVEAGPEPPKDSKKTAAAATSPERKTSPLPPSGAAGGPPPRRPSTKVPSEKQLNPASSSSSSNNSTTSNNRSHSPRKGRGVRATVSTTHMLQRPPASPTRRTPVARTTSATLPRSPRRQQQQQQDKEEAAGGPRKTGRQRLLQAFNSPTKKMREISLSGDVGMACLSPIHDNATPKASNSQQQVHVSPRKMPGSAADLFVQEPTQVHKDISPGRQKKSMGASRKLPLSPENLFGKKESVSVSVSPKQQPQSPPTRRQTRRATSSLSPKRKTGASAGEARAHGIPMVNSEMFAPPLDTKSSRRSSRVSLSPKKQHRRDPSSSVSLTSASTKSSSVVQHRELPASPNDLFGGCGGGGDDCNNEVAVEVPAVSAPPPARIRRSLSPKKGSFMPEDLFHSDPGAVRAPGAAPLPIRSVPAKPQRTEHRELPSCPNDCF